MAESKVLTKHPLGKKGRTIDKGKYDAVKRVLVAALRSQELTHTELTKAVVKKLKGKFDGNIAWNGETVKLDLEARKTIERTASRPQRYRLR